MKEIFQTQLVLKEIFQTKLVLKEIFQPKLVLKEIFQAKLVLNEIFPTKLVLKEIYETKLVLQEILNVGLLPNGSPMNPLKTPIPSLLLARATLDSKTVPNLRTYQACVTKTPPARQHCSLLSCNFSAVALRPGCPGV